MRSSALIGVRDPDRGAGLMFYNDQGDEQGGLTYSGRNGQQGEALTFDAWHQDQALEIQHGDDANGSDSYVAGSELPKTSLYDDLVPYQREIAALADTIVEVLTSPASGIDASCQKSIEGSAGGAGLKDH